jgi:DNA polymerase-4
MKKPDGFTVLTQESLPGKLLTLKLTDLPGIGRNMEQRLKRAGVHSVADFWNISPKHARKIWGSVQGERFWYWIHGYDFELPENDENVMIGHSRVLDPKMRGPDEARLMARRLLTKATYRLRRKEYFASVLSLGVRTIHDERWRAELRLTPPAHDPFTFLEALDVLWDQMMIDTGGYQRLRKISTVLSGLKHRNEITGDLLDESHRQTMRILGKREALANALDTLQKKYQKETVWLGTVPKTLSGYVGTKIAFSRVPDTEEFWN